MAEGGFRSLASSWKGKVGGYSVIYTSLTVAVAS